MAISQVAKESMTIPRRELFAIKLAVKNVGQIKKATGVDEKDVCFYTDSQIAICWIEKHKKEGPSQLGEFISNTTKFILGENKISEEIRDIRWVPGNLNNGDKITRRAKVEDLFSNKQYWFEPPLEFNEGVPKFECDQFGTIELDSAITERALISKNKKLNMERKLKRTILSEVFDDGKDLKRGMLAIFFIIKFLASFRPAYSGGRSK